MVTLVRTDDRCSCAASIRHLTAHPTLACLGVADLLRDDMSTAYLRLGKAHEAVQCGVVRTSASCGVSVQVPGEVPGVELPDERQRVSTSCLSPSILC